MPYEIGGRAAKNGNRFEVRWTIYQILEVLEEKLNYVVLEAIGDDEQGIDIWIGNKDGSKEGQQCKGRNGSKEYWTYGDTNQKKIFNNWKYHLDRDKSNKVSLVSPLAFTLLEDLIYRARNTNKIPDDFYKGQILSSSQENINFFENYCDVMEIDWKKESGIIRCIDYLERTSYRQWPDSELREIVLEKISRLLNGNEKDIYDNFVSWIVDGDILGKEINQTLLYDFLEENNIILKSLANDTRIIPRFKELNEEYKNHFIPFNDGLIERDEFSICREKVELEESLIIHGRAGIGKSGCTQDIIKYCEENVIPYLAIKLDKNIPSVNADKWSEELGLPASIPHCIHSISKNKQGVIILDQLDALRWTQSHSWDSLKVCSQIINQVEKINYEREHKISIVFVCRTYDLENDNNIKKLFQETDKKNIDWCKIEVSELDTDSIKTLIGDRYELLTDKLKKILKIPSNLYIWQKLDSSKEYNECSTANHLIIEWWSQLSSKYSDIGQRESDLNTAKKELMTKFNESKKIYLPLQILNINRSCLEFLSSNDFLIIQENKVSFAHQSILDYFLAEKMFILYHDNKDIVEIIGNKEKQTPGRRYQVQMFMQSLIEYDSQDFLEVGKKILESQEIRYSIKFIFFEVLNQVDTIDENIKCFIINNCQDKEYSDHIINNVINSKPHYIRLLREYGILEEWFNIAEKKDIVMNLLISMSPRYNEEDILFIEKKGFKSKEDDNIFLRCFRYDINEDSDEMFELRMKFYYKYPQMANIYFDVEEMLKKCEVRTIRVMAFLLENKINSKDKSTYGNENYFLNEDFKIVIQNGIDVVNLLLPYIPVANEKITSLSGWSGRSFQNNSIERTCIEIIKKANESIINIDPETFLEIYKDYMGKGYYLFNEIILESIYNLPENYSDLVIKYLCSDLDNNIFDKTSGNSDQLLLSKNLFSKFCQHCNKSNFELLVKTVIDYISPDAKDRYQKRIEFNKENNGCKVYWSFWGDLQKDILEVLPYDRLSNEAKNLLCVLKRKYKDINSRYKYSDGYSGIVSSPIAGKKISNKRWLEILTNKKINEKRNVRFKQGPEGIIESSIEEFSRSFESAVSAEPQRMIELILSEDKEILEIYIDSLFSGIAHSKFLEDVSVDLLERMILRYKYDHTSYRANYICTIIEEKNISTWEEKILDILKDIAVNHKNPELDKSNLTDSKDEKIETFDMLQIEALNSSRSKAIRAIGSLLWQDSDLFEQFKGTIEKMTLDKSSAVKFASLFALWPSYNINKDWASEKIINLYKEDYRLAGFRDTKNMFFRLYPNYREQVLDIIKKCFESEDKELTRIGGFSLAEMFILKNEFVNEMSNMSKMNKNQAQAVLEMAITYFNIDEYSISAKEIIYKFVASRIDLKIPISRLFYNDLIDLERDKKFLIDIMSLGMDRRLVHAFTTYLEKESKSVIAYRDIIISVSYNLIENRNDRTKNVWGVEDEISKLVINLYDETVDSSQDEIKSTSNDCLDILDMMFEKEIGSVRRLSKEMMER